MIPYSLKKSVPALLSLFIFTIMLASTARAQMFSVEEEETVQRSPRSPTTAVYVGWEPAEFTFEGNAESGMLAGVYAFDGPLLRFRLETLGVEAYMGVGGELTGIDDIGYFDAGIKAGQGLPLFRSPGFLIMVPLQIKSSINTVSNNQAGTDTQFRQGTLEFGGGAHFSARFGKGIRFAVEAIPNYGFSFASGGIFGGQIFEMEGKSRFYVDRLFGDIGLTAGVDYSFKRFDIDDNEFDYNFESFSIVLGINF